MLLVAALAAFAACNDSPTNQEALLPSPARMDIVSGNGQSAVEGTELPDPLVVRVTDGEGQPIGNQIVNFRVTAGGGSAFGGTALTNGEGLAQERWTLGAAGETQTLEARAVDAASGEKQVFATFSATSTSAEEPEPPTSPAPTVASVSVSPLTANVAVGGTRQLTATARDSEGEDIAGRTFAWSSSNTSVATVSTSGLVTGRAAGTATITASTGGESGTAAITVTSAPSSDTTPPGTPGVPALTVSAASEDSVSVTATWTAGTDAAKYTWRTGTNSDGYNKNGETTGRTATFRVPLLANAGGYWFCVTAVDAAGNSSEEDACNGYDPPTSPGVDPVEVATVVLSPATASVAVGATRQISASARDADGNTISGKTFTWASSNTGVATVSSSGLVTARAAGSTTITASVDGKSGTSAVTVTAATAPTPPTVESVTLSPTSASLTVGGTRQFTATARDGGGNAIAGKTFTWQSSNTGVATVSASGLVTARAAGNANITASVDGESATASVTVQASDPGGGGSSGARLVEDFSTYTSTANMLSDPRGIYLASENVNAEDIALDSSVGYGGSGKSMRYTHTTGQTISRSLNLGGWSIPASGDLWTEIVVRFSPGWVVGAAYKLLHLNTNVSNGARFGLNFESGTGGTLNAEAPAANYDAGHLPTVRSTSLFDGNWHTIRYHTQINGGEVFHEVWVDGQYQGSRGPLAARSGGHDYNIISLGANMNESNGQTQHLWWGKVSVWTSDPGW